ncbi:glyoxylase-like metal-dependent hydrolase (beta-lactamase superfamily II) [Pullulanibacillus pueri]|uniref:MBL fold metallo-hydrolase n=1 Tax=Pullulanibacillus pueri TaxID=1437324 RepID=A0A8J2ZU42_9BACL|nr:MBL fold metallo-hydrolase [Pullulanibacillus pueri]MBM7681413.1 glyoxylase-like metal-dependent hydrolase (beta-lactamase superfamily II) [Pullulanibacillus pueri]GGH78778.1 MBL fold metallo-hydrolase [Pullulanibacillus pueri]
MDKEHRLEEHQQAPPVIHPIIEFPKDIERIPCLIVNAYLVGDPGENTDWILVDTGLANSADKIQEAAFHRFGDQHPKAIILTHGHFDHIGSLEELLDHWHVPVFAHELELPYLTGQKDYPAADPTVGGGLMSLISPLYPHSRINLGKRIQPLPQTGQVPFMDQWRWLATPGHSPGHISLWREQDRTLITGDAFITVEQESALSVMSQNEEVHGPPKYFTTDWKAAEQSVKRLNELNPAFAYTGHGQPMKGQPLTQGLNHLASQFQTLAVPDHGRYLH